VSALQTIYGVREADRFDADKSNGTLAAAKTIKFVSDAGQLQGTDGMAGSDPYVVAGDLTTLNDIDVYKFVVPSGGNDFNVSFRTEGISLLTAKVTVRDSTGKVIASATATDPANSDLSLFVSGAKGGATYDVQVEKAVNNVFGTGAYRLAVGKEAAEAVAPAFSGYVNNDNHKNDTASAATKLGDAKPGADQRWDFTYRGSISDDKDSDWYEVKTKSDTPGTLLVTIWATETGKLDPVVSVYDKNHMLVASQVLSNDSTSHAVQIRNIVPGDTYYVKVAATDPKSSYKEGNYFLGVDFRANAVVLDTFATGALTNADRQAESTLAVNQTQLFNFVLGATSADPAIASAVRMTILDQSGRVVFTLTAKAGTTVSNDVFLQPGTYTVRFSGGTENQSGTMPNLDFSLLGQTRSDPIGATAVNTSTAPAGSTTTTKPPPATLSKRTVYSGAYSSPYRPL